MHDGPAGRGGPGCEAPGEDGVQRARQAAREVVVVALGELPPVLRLLPYEHQHAADPHERGGGTRRVAGQFLPDAFAGRYRGELALGAQPLLDVGEGERGARLGAAHGQREVGVPAAPIADGGASDPGEPGDPGGRHLCRVLRHGLPPDASGVALSIQAPI